MDSSDYPDLSLTVCDPLFKFIHLVAPAQWLGINEGTMECLDFKIHSLSSNPLLWQHTQTLPPTCIKIIFYELKITLFNGFQKFFYYKLKSSTQKRWICAHHSCTESRSVSLKTCIYGLERICFKIFVCMWEKSDLISQYMLSQKLFGLFSAS